MTDCPDCAVAAETIRELERELDSVRGQLVRRDASICGMRAELDRIKKWMDQVVGVE